MFDDTKFDLGNYTVGRDLEVEMAEKKAREDMCEQSFIKACGSEKFRNVEFSQLGELQNVTFGKGENATKSIISKYIDDVANGNMRFLWLCGNPGTGKTILAVAVIHELCRRGFSCAYFKSHKIMQRLRDAERFSSGINPKDVLSEIIAGKFRVIDEIGRWPVPEWERFRLFDIINDLYEEYKPAIFISNMSGHDLADFIGTAATDRFRGSGMILEFRGESYRGTKDELYVTNGGKNTHFPVKKVVV